MTNDRLVFVTSHLQILVIPASCKRPTSLALQACVRCATPHYKQTTGTKVALGPRRSLIQR